MSCFALPDEGVLDESVLSDVNEQLLCAHVAGPSSSSLNASEERGNVEDPSATYTPHEQISLCLQHCDR